MSQECASYIAALRDAQSPGYGLQISELFEMYIVLCVALT